MAAVILKPEALANALAVGSAPGTPLRPASPFPMQRPAAARVLGRGGQCSALGRRGGWEARLDMARPGAVRISRVCVGVHLCRGSAADDQQRLVDLMRGCARYAVWTPCAYDAPLPRARAAGITRCPLPVCTDAGSVLPCVRARCLIGAFCAARAREVWLQEAKI